MQEPPVSVPGGSFDPSAALDALLGEFGLSSGDAGGAVEFAGADPILPSRLRLGAAIGIPISSRSPLGPA
jgi:hypothetical protein